jgi:hypothetical protein
MKAHGHKLIALLVIVGLAVAAASDKRAREAPLVDEWRAFLDELLVIG